MKKTQIGVIADDFTGGSDAASFLSKHNAKTIFLNGVPEELEEEGDCIVIANKFRSVPPQDAVLQAKKAFDYLNSKKVEKYYFKYCSTFDSTPKGNIGPVLDHLMQWTGEKYTLLCPSLPVNGRTVKDGVLYIHGVPLAETSMKDHPLNPMWDSSISNLMRPQSVYPCYSIRLKGKSREQIEEEIAEYSRASEHFYLIPDYETDEDGKLIVECFGHLKLLSGGSGLLEFLAPRYHENVREKYNSPSSRYVIVAGSCSKMTEMQVRHYLNTGGKGTPVDAARLMDGSLTIEDLTRRLDECSGKGMMFYTSRLLDRNNEEVDEMKSAEQSRLMESALSRIAAYAASHGFRKIISAGGETSGAVTQALGYSAYIIGESIAPGVPVLIPVQDKTVRIFLKSGNFGQEDFFERAVKY